MVHDPSSLVSSALHLGGLKGTEKEKETEKGTHCTTTSWSGSMSKPERAVVNPIARMVRSAKKIAEDLSILRALVGSASFSRCRRLSGSAVSSVVGGEGEG